MRFVPLDNAKEGMVLAKRLYGNNGQLLLNYGVKLQKGYIDRIRVLGYRGVYIDDEISKDIRIEDIIDESIKIEAIDNVRALSQKIEKGNSITNSDYSNLHSIVNEMLDQILDRRNVLINMIDLKTFDDYTFSHSVSVGILSMSIGTFMNMNKNALSKLGTAAFMHDLGKIFVPKRILNKPAKLDKEEMEIMKTHSMEGYVFLEKKMQVSEDVRMAVLEHHERPDGGGYPSGKTHEKITRLASIISVADVYDALISQRPYRKAKSPSEAVEYIMGNVNTQFSEKTVNAFLKKIAPYPVGTLVNLSNDTVGIVIANYPEAVLRPKVKIIREKNKKAGPYAIDLKNDPSLLNVTILGTSNLEIEDY